MGSRIARENDSLQKMFTMFCKKHHKSDVGLCCDCRKLAEYALNCISHCSYGESKPVCGRCPVNCFRGDMHKKMNIVMRYAGPRMLIKHPMLTAMHIIDAFKKT